MLERLKSERGIALPMVLGVMMVLTISVLATIEYSGANARNASLGFAGQNAKAVAEAGVHHGASVLYEKVKAQPSTYVSNLSGTAAVPDGPRTYSVPWTATYIGTGPGTAREWRVSATSSVPNPTGPVGPVRRTVSARFKVEVVQELGAWKGVYAASQKDGECFLQNQIVVKTPAYIQARGDKSGGDRWEVCIKDTGTKFLGNFLAVRGWFQSRNTGSTVGQPAATSVPSEPNYPNEYRVPDVMIQYGCRDNKDAANRACTTADRVYRCDPIVDDCYVGPGEVPVIPKPQVEPSWGHHRTNAKPGPNQGCTEGSFPYSFSNTGVEIDLMPSSGYNCIVREGSEIVGQIRWQPGVPGPHGTLTVKGIIFFNGKVLLKDSYGVVDGRAVIYVRDTLMMDSGSGGALCGKVKGAWTGRPHCDFREYSPETPTVGWDPATSPNFLQFVVGESTCPTSGSGNDCSLSGARLNNSIDLKGGSGGPPPSA